MPLLVRRRRRSSALFRWGVGQAAPTGLSFTGGAGRTELDSVGGLSSVGANVPRLNAYALNSSSVLVPGWLLEGPSTNHFLQSGTPATQTTSSLATGTYTVWLVGTGQIVVSAGTATITGAGTATAAAPVTFVVTVAGTVVYTVSGSPTRAQAENLAFPTSYIPTTTNPVTRSAEMAPISLSSLPLPFTLYLSEIDQGTGLIPNARYFAFDGVHSLAVYTNGSASGLTAQFVDGAGNPAVGLGASAAPAVGDSLEIRLIVDALSCTQFGVSRNGAAEILSPLSAAAVAAVPNTLYVGSVGAGLSHGFTANRALKIARGVQSLSYMRAA